MNQFSPSNTDFRINGRELTSWGTSTPPLKIEPIDASGTLVRGEGGGAIAFYRDNEGYRVTVNLLPGTADSAYMSWLKKGRANLTFSHTVIGTLEGAIGAEGIFTNRGSLDRAGTTSASDDSYIMEFNTSDINTGGSD